MAPALAQEPLLEQFAALHAENQALQAGIEEIEPTDHVSERALRPAVLWRKGCFGSDSEAGSRVAERLLTVVATCRQQGRPLLDFLVAAGEVALRRTAVPSLLPTHPEWVNADYRITTAFWGMRSRRDRRMLGAPGGVGRAGRRSPVAASATADLR